MTSEKLMSDTDCPSPFSPRLPTKPGERLRWGRLYGSSVALSIAAAVRQHPGLAVVISPDVASMERLEDELRFYLRDGHALPVLTFPDWETLPYDAFSPHQDIVSQRLETLYRLPGTDRGLLIVPVSTLMHRLMPHGYLEAHSFVLKRGDRLPIEPLRRRLEAAGYRCVSEVMEHGEFAVRGGLADLFPMGSATPYRIELFDDEVESLRTFDPENQRSVERVPEVRLLPAHEFPLDEAGIARFRQHWRATFGGDALTSQVYRDVGQGLSPAGIEYYLPLFFEETATLFDYLPTQSLILTLEGTDQAAEKFWQELTERFEQHRYDRLRPLLPPARLFLQANEVFAAANAFPRVQVQTAALETRPESQNFCSAEPPPLPVDARAPKPLAALQEFLQDMERLGGRALLAAESTGRREVLLDLLRGGGLHPSPCEGWEAFLASESPFAITVAPLEHGLWLEQPRLAVIAEGQLFGERATPRRRREEAARDAEQVIRDLAELTVGAPVVHEAHGVGRYLGLQRLAVDGIEAEFLVLEYDGGDKLYTPVSSLHSVRRYTGVSPEQAPLHRLGSGQWERAKRKAAEQVRDVAAELLELHARRKAKPGHAFSLDREAYAAFVQGFPFEETPDQDRTIRSVLTDLQSATPMDRLVCGDVGFGKTEVALRAAFAAVQDGHQVAMLVPTTLLAQQHYQNFADRFAGWPVRIQALSRFLGRKQQQEVLKGLADGQVDIVIGTHRLLSQDVKFKRLGLVIVDEEHRFGVRHKERLKALRAEVDLLTLTATPIPRTLNMALAGLRDLSIIATPPAKRLTIKTFVREWDNTLIREAVLREILRGGQVYFLHNEVETIEKAFQRLQALVPEANLRIAHGQMRERELERVMLDFYHQRFNVLVCTTIIESGIDVPSANTIIIHRADHFGLAQLHQLRGRVGRSHHRAYAYLIVPPRPALSADAVKRLEAIESLEDLGAGFTLATHDLEIRGAGELLGEEQSGHIQEIGFSLYMEYLERAVSALKSGHEPALDRVQAGEGDTEIDLHIPALLPDDYLPDVHVRLVMYKRIASSTNEDQLRELQVEMIDRFGLLPEAAKNLFRLAELKLRAKALGIRKIDLGPQGGRVQFHPHPHIDPLRVIQLIQGRPQTYKLDGQDRLRLLMALPDAASRFGTAEGLLDALALPSGTRTAV
jgi:transcription-repair coupling factor (superfamily II helicase)